MRYLGGKARIAKHLAPVITSYGLPVWEPFVGGANITPHLGSTRCSDINPALIAMYQALQGGWLPPEFVSPDEYQAAKLLPDTDPMKAWCGFACSFAGMWFRSYGLDKRRPNGTVQISRASVLKLVPPLRAATFECIDFLTVDPSPWHGLIYADPPYAGTTGYGQAFDSARFWQRVQQWEAHGVPVLVSEYSCPVPHEVVWERSRNLEMRHGREQRTERLFRVHV